MTGAQIATLEPGHAEGGVDEVARRGWDPILNEAVESWPLPARMLHWCRTNKITTVAQLVMLSEAGLADERNLGMKSLADTRLIIEFRFGVSWENVRRAMLGLDLKVGDPPGWEALPTLVPDEIARLPVREFRLPKRLANYCEREGLQTLGDLVAIPRSKLVASRNLGLASLAQAEQTIRDVVATLEAQRATWSQGLLVSWEHVLGQLAMTHRAIIRRRAGFDGAPETQAQIGHSLGVSNVRVRQVEKKQLALMRRQGTWLEFVRGRLAELMAKRGGAVAVAELAEDSWWAGFDDRPYVLDYFCRTMLEGAHRVVSLDGNDYLTALTEEQFEQAWRELRRVVAAYPTPAPLERVKQLAQRFERSVGATLVRVLWDRLEPLLQIDRRGGQPPRVVAFGTNRAVQALAMLRASKVPLPVDDVIARVGRFNPIDEMIYLERGLIGVEEHFPGFKRWQERIVPAARRIMQDKGPERQWTCSELLRELEKVVQLPDWIGHWPLAGLLRRSGEFEYLGYLRFLLPADQRGPKS